LGFFFWYRGGVSVELKKRLIGVVRVDDQILY
jgi:hypothetical protein